MRQLGAVAVAAGSLVIVTLTACSPVVDGHGSLLTIGSERRLSVAAVAAYIERELGATGVMCNKGKDFLMERAGQSFRCTSDGGQTYTVTITNPNNGSYEVS